MTGDDLAPCIARSSVVAMVMAMQDKCVLVFPEEGCQPPVPLQH